MRNLLFIALALLIISCGKKEEKKTFEYAPNSTKEVKKTAPTQEKASFEDMIDLENKGIGPITSVALNETLDQDLVKKGEDFFKINCMACHKTERKFIGPALGDITAKRSPEWIMNMTMNTAQMIKEDPLAKGIYEEYDKAPMVTAPVNKEDARAVLEYLISLNP